MRAKGITYDTGFLNQGVSTRPSLDPVTVREDMRVIREELHCTALRVTGGDPDRLELAATIAAEAGLEVWFGPFTCDLTWDELLDVLADCATRAERLRATGAEVVFVTGAELSMFTKGFLPGDDLDERLALLSDRDRLIAALPTVPARMNDFLGKAVAVVRERFGGKVTYASIQFEGVDWTPFDFRSIDLYRTAEIADRFEPAVRALVASGKPVAITEFGSATFRGAAARGARGAEIVVYEGLEPIGLDGDYTRDEAEQAAVIGELLDIFEAAGVDSAFVNTFSSHHLPHRLDDPRRDLDLGGYGVVKVLDDGTWQRKAAFAGVAGHYGAR
ncbi:hypothetical protein ALI22I_37660 [Saccharothrix sp. ALI-22-I]|uniref:hypothetical protein n=1 Tax=Saccharothrix sp. ALI-22-I TaxID=1933778 RepID=UPI00097C1FA2|nr:hypothetical protein [Saccharothrix sp. ALI-22-I]ONI81916.1 hypothetical protein ALI22I_37660 [Saccharothrix sp. ALI-22-I]